MNSKKIVAIVPARSGSKRLPGKNIKKLAGRPLIYHTIDALLGHEEIKKVVFTSESEEYLRLVSVEYGDQVVLHKRPEHFASDKIKIFDEVKRLAQAGELETPWFMLCLPTAPLRNFDVVKQLLIEWGLDQRPRFTATSYNFPVQFSFTIDSNNNWIPCFKHSPMETGNTRSQDIQKTYRPNGAVYLNTVNSLYSNKTFYQGAVPFLMTTEQSIDIDSELDFDLAEKFMRNANG